MLGAGGAARAAKDGGGGTGYVTAEGFESAVSGERATRAPAVEEAAWDGLREKGGLSHDYLEDLTQNLSKRGCYVRSKRAIQKGTARSKIKYYQVYHQVRSNAAGLTICH